MSKIDLKSCPFCGGEPLLGNPGLSRLWRISCKNCDAAPSSCFSPEDAAAKWNTRRADAPAARPYQAEPIDLISAADAFDEIEVNSDGLCRWTDVANALSMLRAEIRALPHSAATSAIPRPLEEWHEDMGPMLWWRFPIEEEPYVGSPLDIGFTVQFDMEMTMRTHTDPEGEDAKFTCRRDVGGWPGYHTHFTPIPQPEAPADPRNQGQGGGPRS